MKVRNIIFLCALVLLVVFAYKGVYPSAQDEVVPDYGLTPSGKIFIREDVAKRLYKFAPGEGVYVAGNWTGKNKWVPWTQTELMDYHGVGVYVLDTKMSFTMKRKVVLVFMMGKFISQAEIDDEDSDTQDTNAYFPQAAYEKKDASYKEADILLNKEGDGRNLKIAVGTFDFL